MKYLFKKYAAFAVFLTFIGWMVLQADMKHKNIIMDIGHSVPHGDKIGHFLLFGILALLLNVALSFRVVSLKYRRFHLGSVLVLGLAVAEEFSQLAFSHRTFDFVDMLFDLFGIGLLSSISFRQHLVIASYKIADYLSYKLQT